MSALKAFALTWLSIFLGMVVVAVTVLGCGLAIGSVFGDGEPAIRVGGFFAGLALASLGVTAFLWLQD